jgi:hypothetical protein
MMVYMKQIIQIRIDIARDFSLEEINLIGIGFRNFVGVLQASIKVLTALGKTKKYRKYGTYIPLFKMKLQKKLKGQCLENVEELKRAYKVCADN